MAATCLGAEIIEKHFTIDNNFSNFRDHKLSSNPEEMRKIVNLVRKTEKILGKFDKNISKTEKVNKKSSRRSIFAKVEIKKNEKITHEKIKIVRPEEGLEPLMLSRIISKKVLKKINKSEPIKKKFK